MLKLIEMSCGYGAFCAVDTLNLTIDKGQIFALVGANGAGKSSTIMTIAGHVKVLHGAIEFDGHEITGQPSRDRVYAGIALAPEGRRLFPDLSVSENLSIGGYSRKKAHEAANRDRVLALFPRLKQRFKQRAGVMSGGEQQMLAIGRALMAEPRLLMIDEVSLGLMPKAIDVCYEAISELRAQGMTILLVEQNTERALAIADAVCVLESGRAVWQGSAKQARDNPQVIAAYLGAHEDVTRVTTLTEHRAYDSNAH